MRIIRNLNLGWRFSRTDTKDYVDTKMDSFEEVDIPHSWNAEEACEGDQFYTRAAYWYQYDLFKDSSWDSKKVFIEFEGSNSITEIYINGEKLGRNELGFSTFRYELTAHLKDGENLISVRVDNRDYEHIYPRSADFTFF